MIDAEMTGEVDERPLDLSDGCPGHPEHGEDVPLDEEAPDAIVTILDEEL